MSKGDLPEAARSQSMTGNAQTLLRPVLPCQTPNWFLRPAPWFPPALVQIGMWACGRQMRTHKCTRTRTRTQTRTRTRTCSHAGKYMHEQARRRARVGGRSGTCLQQLLCGRGDAGLQCRHYGRHPLRSELLSVKAALSARQGQV